MDEVVSAEVLVAASEVQAVTKQAATAAATQSVSGAHDTFDAHSAVATQAAEDANDCHTSLVATAAKAEVDDKNIDVLDLPDQCFFHYGKKVWIAVDQLSNWT